MINRTCKALALGALLCILPLTGLAQDSAAQAKTLAGLKGFFVVINDAGQVAHSANISVPALRDQAESALRTAGLRVASREEFLASQDRSLALLGITISAATDPAGNTSAISCFLQVTQTVVLVRDSSVRAPVATWYTGGTGIATTDVAQPELEKRLADLMEHFLEAYWSVNPK